MSRTVRLRVNGREHELSVDERDSLLDVLRERLGLTGAKRGCDMGECGACTVLLEGRPVNACLVLAADADGHSVLTIEGLAGEELHPIQRAFVEHGAVQCGFCTPGMILSARALLEPALERDERPSREAVRHGLSGNLCRCTGYRKVVDAVIDAFDRLRGAGRCG